MSGKKCLFIMMSLIFSFGIISSITVFARDDIVATFPCNRQVSLPGLIELTPNWPLAHPPISCCAAPGKSGAMTFIFSSITRARDDGTLSDDTIRIDSMSDAGVNLSPAVYKVMVTEACMGWVWEEGELFPYSGRLGKRAIAPGPLRQINVRERIIRYTFFIRVKCEGAEPSDECPQWNEAMKDQSLENYRKSLQDRHSVQARLDRHYNTLANCSCQNRFFKCIVCRAAQSSINAINRQINGYVDDCERILDILSNPGKWNNLINCLRNHGFYNLADYLDTHCDSPEDVCSRIHNQLMGFMSGATSNTSAYRQIPSCFRTLYPNQRIFDAWYLSGLRLLW